MVSKVVCIFVWGHLGLWKDVASPTPWTHPQTPSIIPLHNRLIEEWWYGPLLWLPLHIPMVETPIIKRYFEDHLWHEPKFFVALRTPDIKGSWEWFDELDIFRIAECPVRAVVPMPNSNLVVTNVATLTTEELIRFWLTPHFCITFAQRGSTRR